mmetsp:Transcript_15689/g.26455  ORF Transcript_15689/g.26455 Transcript_15689/m.26455 type:complete len:109 (+) Transcript_15689:880-1206(+)
MRARKIDQGEEYQSFVAPQIVGMDVRSDEEVTSEPGNKRDVKQLFSVIFVLGSLIYVYNNGLNLPCLKSKKPERNYRPVNEGLPDAGSDNESDNDDEVTAKDRMLELS